MEQIAYVNGSFVPLSEAKVSILDRGFLFADGIYEVAAVLDGKLIDNASHLARLERSVGEIAAGAAGNASSASRKSSRSWSRATISSTAWSIWR